MLMDEAGGVKASARDVAQWVSWFGADPTASPVLQAGIQRARNSGTRNLRRCIRGWAGKCWITR